MKQEDRLALRAFYQTLAKDGFTAEQLALYAAMKTSKQARLEWVQANGKTLNIPPDVLAILSTVDGFTKEDIAIILAAQVAPVIAAPVQKAIGGFWAWGGWPWNWFK